MAMRSLSQLLRQQRIARQGTSKRWNSTKAGELSPVHERSPLSPDACMPRYSHAVSSVVSSARADAGPQTSSQASPGGPQEPLPEPPGTFETIGAMGAGGEADGALRACACEWALYGYHIAPVYADHDAWLIVFSSRCTHCTATPLPHLSTTMPAALGAVFIAGVGVYAVFKMAFFVASGTGRSINAGEQQQVGGSTAVQVPTR